ncbi:MAG: DNA-processing protein DprA [Spirochaetota bacterium]|nr:MAG: DNA-processing protein DprA [Spirochaetota bacterium]
MNKYLLVFNRITNYTPKQKLDLYAKYGGALEIFNKREEAEAIFKKPFKINNKDLHVESELKSIERDIEQLSVKGIKIIDISDSCYPVRLKYIYDPPVVLFAEGRTELLGCDTALGIVGARKASNWGISVAYSIGKELSKVGITVVSGLAFGIDYYTHKGALDGSKSTIAVLGNGMDIVYPKGNRDMYERIRKEGLLVSEFPLGTSPFKYNFPQRNRIISGLSQGVVVVEASKSSGALITANYALEQGREVMAFPGKASTESYTGNNSLIKDGAHLVEDVQDILAVLGKDLKYKSEKSTFSSTSLEGDILKVIGDERVSLEEIEKVMQKSVSEIASALMMLELHGAVIQYPGKIFARVATYGR